MKLMDIRRAQLLTVRELAARAGVSFSTVNNIENGTVKKPTMAACTKIAQALGLAPQMIDEFTPTVGQPETLRALLTPEQMAADLAAIEAGKREGYVDAEAMWALAEAQPANKAA